MGLHPPTVSAIIPTRNRPKSVIRAARSALNQTCRDMEVIVVVDGPDPATLKALSAIIDPRLSVITLQESVGGAEARNIGARAARGKWIALLDDDDEWLPEKIELQLTVAESSASDRVLVVSRFVERASGKPDVLRPRRLPRAGEKICEFMFDFLCYFQTSTFFCSRSLYLEVPFRKDLKSFQDIDWFLRINLKPQIQLHVLPEPLSVYYAPQDRPTITGGLNWRTCLAWGQVNRHLMTRRAYSRFIVGSCAGIAVHDRGGIAAFFQLLKECVARGAPSPIMLALLFSAFIVTPKFRRRVRDAIFLAPYRSYAAPANWKEIA